MSRKTKIVYFYNGKGGGVFSVVRNLLLHMDVRQFDCYLVHTICKEENGNYVPQAIEAKVNEIVFLYSKHWNFYTTCKKLAALLPDESAVLVANDWLELGMASMLGIKNKLVQILHGHYDYYYQLATGHQHVIDRFIAISELMYEALSKLMPDRVNDISYLRFPVARFQEQVQHNTDKHSIAFVGRCTYAKGFHLLPLIDDLLFENGQQMNWHIIGENPAEVKRGWRENANVKFYGNLNADKIPGILSTINLFVLPSLAEGMPLSLIEAMQCGLVPIVNRLEGGMTELVIDGQTGYTIAGNSTEGYAKIICFLLNNPKKMEVIRSKGKNKAMEMFDPNYNTRQYESLYLNLSVSPCKSRVSVKTFGSRLDQKWMPNFFTSTYRRMTTNK
jgi:glycosyltransferase involved in cell wall biosynthesis